jgi:hypothetical protein
MLTYGINEEVTIERVWYVNNLSTGLQDKYDLSAAGYATGNAPLNNLAWGQVTFGLLDAYGNVPNILVGGVAVPATGLFFKMNPSPSTDHFTSYLQYNTSVTPPGYYDCTAVFQKTNGQNAVTSSWQILIQ